MSRLVFGLQPVREAVRAHGERVERVFVERGAGPKLDALARFAEGRGIPVEPLGRAELDRRAAGGRHQGALALAPDLALVSVGELVVGPTTVVVALDGVMDPQNFGAVIRSAVALGAGAVVWPEHASAPLTPATFRASAGAIEHAVLCRVRSLPEALDDLAGRGLTTVALDAQGTVELGDVDLRGPVAIVIGAEDKGTRRPVRRACRFTARLPMAGPIASLNASVAGAIALYEVQRQRRERPAVTRLGLPGAAWAIVAAAVPVHLALALATDLSPDEAYYLCGARLGGRIVDHPPLALWLLAASDRWPGAPVELRVRVWAVAFSLATGVACVALAKARGADREGCTLAAWIGSWALLPMAGGFVTTPDGPLLLAVAVALLSAPLGGLSLLAGALAKVVALPVGVLLAAASRRAAPAARIALAVGPLAALPLLLPSLGFQLGHAYGSRAPDGWSAGGALGAVLAAMGAQALLWSPFVLWRGLRGLRSAPLPDRALVAGLSALVVISALVRAVPPEPNWWAPAALVVVASAAASAPGGLGPARRAILATVLLPTLVAAAHTLRPFLPLPERADPTARLHGWSHGHEPVEAAGVGPYGLAAERCVYRGECTEIRLYFDEMNLHAGSRQ